METVVSTKTVKLEITAISLPPCGSQLYRFCRKWSSRNQLLNLYCSPTLKIHAGGIQGTIIGDWSDLTSTCLFSFDMATFLHSQKLLR